MNGTRMTSNRGTPINGMNGMDADERAGLPTIIRPVRENGVRSYRSTMRTAGAFRTRRE